MRYPDGNVVRLLTFVYRARVEDFATLRRSGESEELPKLDVIETSQPVINAYLDPPPDLFLE